MKAGKIIAAVLAVILGLVAVGMLVGGGALVWAHTTQRDADEQGTHHFAGGKGQDDRHRWRENGPEAKVIAMLWKPSGCGEGRHEDQASNEDSDTSLAHVDPPVLLVRRGTSPILTQCPR